MINSAVLICCTKLRQNFEKFDIFLRGRVMNLFQNTTWFLGVFTFVALFTGSSLLFSGELNDQPGMIQFSNLSDSDIEMIIAVKEEMRAAQVQAN